MSIFSAIFHFFTDLFDASKSAFDKLPDNVKTGLLNGSGIISIIDQYKDQDPKLTIATIQANYPDENLEAIYSGLVLVAKSYNLDVPATLEDLVLVIQSHLKAVDATIWPAVISGAASILATCLSGKGTPFEIIFTLLQFVYTNFIKPKSIKLAALPTETGLPLSENTITIGAPIIIPNV